jgi:hypothetical protein
MATSQAYLLGREFAIRNPKSAIRNPQLKSTIHGTLSLR